MLSLNVPRLVKSSRADLDLLFRAIPGGEIPRGKGSGTLLLVRAIVAKVYPGPSWSDGKPCIVLDYAKTSVIAHFALSFG